MSFQSIGSALKLKWNNHIYRDVPQISRIRSCERAFPPSFSGSLTIEASLALPLFMFFAACIIHFLVLLSLQADIQVHIEEAARDLSRKAYTVTDSDSASLALVNPLTIRSKILDDDLTDRIEGSAIRGGVSGFHTVLSSYNPESGEMNIAASYLYDFPYLPSGIGSVSFIQKCSCRAWIGKELDQSNADGEGSDPEGRTVYITPTGSAYHSTPSCPYLDLSITTVSAGDLASARNHSGGIYGKCACAIPGLDHYYVTGYGTLYHSDLKCSRLKRTVMAVDISEVGGRHQCPKCAP